MKKNSSLTYKEIYGQPESFKGINDSLGEIYEVLDRVFDNKNTYDELIFTGCGTSFYLAQSAAHAFSTYTGISARAVPCSELFSFLIHLSGTRKYWFCRSQERAIQLR